MSVEGENGVVTLTIKRAIGAAVVRLSKNQATWLAEGLRAAVGDAKKPRLRVLKNG